MTGVSTSYVLSLLRAADAMFKLKGLDVPLPELNRQKSATIPLQEFEYIWQRILQSDESANLGVRIGEHIYFGAYGLLSHIFICCSNVMELIQKLVKFQGLIGDHLSIKLESDSSSLTLRFIVSPHLTDDQLGDQVALFEMSSLVTVIREISNTTFKPILISSTAFGGCAVESAVHFGCQILSQQKENSIAFPKEALEMRIATKNEKLLQVLEIHAGNELMEREGKKLIADKVRDYLLRQFLTCGLIPKLGEAALHQNMSVRTLQRALRAENCSFQEIAENIVLDYAKKYLKFKQLSISQVSCKLGFSDPSVFTRYFKRMTGSPPENYRSIA